MKVTAAAVVVVLLGWLGGRNLIVTSEGLLWVAGGIAVFQLCLAFFFHLFLRRRGRAGPGLLPESSPKVSVLVAVKGVFPEMKGALESLLDQDYPGEREYLFVVPKREDPAFEFLEEMVSDEMYANVLVSDAEPKACSEANLNFLHGAEHSDEDSDYLVFADADLLVERDFLRELCAPLTDPSCGATTSSELFDPEGGLGSLGSLLWIGGGLPCLAAMPFVCGHAMAIRRLDFFSWGLPAAFRRSLGTDAPMGLAAAAHGKKIAFPSKAMPVSAERPAWSAFLTRFDRWMVYGRIYAPGLWVLGGFALAGKSCLYVSGIWPAFFPELVFGLLAADGVYFLAIFASLRTQVLAGRRGLEPPSSGVWLRAALLGPFMHFIYTWNFLRSMWVQDMRWGEYVCRVRGPEDVEVARL